MPAPCPPPRPTPTGASHSARQASRTAVMRAPSARKRVHQPTATSMPARARAPRRRRRDAQLTAVSAIPDSSRGSVDGGCDASVTPTLGAVLSSSTDVPASTTAPAQAQPRRPHSDPARRRRRARRGARARRDRRDRLCPARRRHGAGARDAAPDPLDGSSQVFAADGTRLGFIQSDELRSPVGWNEIPADLKNATVAIEDQRFYKNDGVDLTGIFRSAIKDITHGAALQGGSTITMQLVRNLYLGGDQHTLSRRSSRPSSRSSTTNTTPSAGSSPAISTPSPTGRSAARPRRACRPPRASSSTSLPRS